MAKQGKIHYGKTAHASTWAGRGGTAGIATTDRAALIRAAAGELGELCSLGCSRDIRNAVARYAREDELAQCIDTTNVGVLGIGGWVYTPLGQLVADVNVNAALTANDIVALCKALDVAGYVLEARAAIARRVDVTEPVCARTGCDALPTHDVGRRHVPAVRHDNAPTTPAYYAPWAAAAASEMNGTGGTYLPLYCEAHATEKAERLQRGDAS